MNFMKINFFSNVLNMNTDCIMLVPGNIKKDEKIKTLYLCHGGSTDENDWLYNSTIAMIPDKYHIAVVLVCANDSCSIDMALGGKYATHIGEELPAFLQGTFRYLSSSREDQMIAGFSNGGYGCFIIGLMYRKNFCAIGAFSAGDKADSKIQPSLQGQITQRIKMFGQDDISQTDYSIKHLVKKIAKESGVKPNIYHACGGLDPWLDMNHKVKNVMEELNCDEFNYVYDEIEDMGHEWRFWDEEVRRFLKYCGINIVV